MKRILILLLVAAAVFLSGCSEDDDFDAGTALTGEELAAMQVALREEIAAGKEEETAVLPAGVVKGDCYFAENGTVYHLDPNCPYLSGAKKILSGTLKDAAKSGAAKGCSYCVEKEE